MCVCHPFIHVGACLTLQPSNICVFLKRSLFKSSAFVCQNKSETGEIKRVWFLVRKVSLVE